VLIESRRLKSVNGLLYHKQCVSLFLADTLYWVCVLCVFFKYFSLCVCVLVWLLCCWNRLCIVTVVMWCGIVSVSLRETKATSLDRHNKPKRIMSLTVLLQRRHLTLTRWDVDDICYLSLSVLIHISHVGSSTMSTCASRVL